MEERVIDNRPYACNDPVCQPAAGISDEKSIYYHHLQRDGGERMATKSFYETMVIDTPEAAANLAKAIEDYEQYGPYVPGKVQGVTEDPEDLDRFMGVSP